MSKTILTKEQENDIIDKYVNQGISKNKLRLEYGVSEGTIKRCLIRNGIHVRQIEETNVSKYHIDQDFFEYDKQNENSAYVIGLIASDGAIHREENMVYIELQRSDRQILEDVNKVLKNERPVKDYVRLNGYENSKLYFFSKKIKEDLKQYDLIPNKTYEANNFATNIKLDFFPDFVRGFFDGDGCITCVGGTPRWQLDGTSIQTFLTIQKIFKEEYDIELKVVDETKYSKNSLVPLYRVYGYSKEKIQKIFDVLYRNPDCLKLNRKYYRFLELLK